MDTAGVSEGRECDAQTHFVAHETDCNKYYICQHGALQVQSCPANLYWSGGHCDWPENSKCKAGSGPDSIPTTTPEPEESAMPTTTAQPPMAEGPDYQPEVTPPPSTEVVAKPPGDSKYKVVCYFTNWAWYRYVSAW